MTKEEYLCLDQFSNPKGGEEVNTEAPSVYSKDSTLRAKSGYCHWRIIKSTVEREPRYFTLERKKKMMMINIGDRRRRR